MRQAVRPSPVFLALVGLTAGGGVIAWMAGDATPPLAYVGVFLFVIAGWLVSLCLHEFGHAYTAWRFGDHDVAMRGYLTLNPLKYSSPLLSLGLPLLFIALGGIGLPGGAVYLRTEFMTARQRTLVSLAGPSANLVLAILLLAATKSTARNAWPGATVTTMLLLGTSTAQACTPLRRLFCTAPAWMASMIRRVAPRSIRVPAP